MSEYLAVKYRIPVVNLRIVYLCTRCETLVDFEVVSPEMDIYESPHCLCETCQDIVALEDKE